MRATIAIACLLFALSAAHCQAPLLSRLLIRASGPVEVCVPLDGAPESSIYRAGDGSWKPLEVAAEEGKARFSLPADAAGSSIVILQAPDWLALDDNTAPAVGALEVDGIAVEPGESIDLGHCTSGPDMVRLTIADADSPIDAAGAVVTLDGSWLGTDAISWDTTDGPAKSSVLQVKPGELPDGSHRLRIRVPDAAPAANWAEVGVSFASGPLVKDGGFELARADGTPEVWTGSTWSAEADTKAELKVVGGGHSGKSCGELNGIAGKLNLLFGQQLPLSANKTYRVKLFYKATGTGGHISMINASQDDNKQYLNSPTLPASDEWKAFEWEFTTKPSSGYTLYLRNAQKGSVKFDDVSVEEEGRAGSGTNGVARRTA